MDRRTLIAFIDELEKISAAGALDMEKLASYDPELLELMKEAGIFSMLGKGLARGIAKAGPKIRHSGPMKFMRRAARGFPKPGAKLTPRGRARMQRMTGYGQAPERTAFAPRQEAWRRELGGQKMHTELTGMKGTASEQAAKRAAGQQYEASLKRMGAVYQSPGGAAALERRIAAAPGHPRQVTRTPARVVEQGTAAATPRAMAASRPAARPATSVGTVAGGPAARRATHAQRMGTAQTAVAPRVSGPEYSPTVLAPVPA
jgi:hypothetical protein